VRCDVRCVLASSVFACARVRRAVCTLRLRATAAELPLDQRARIITVALRSAKAVNLTAPACTETVNVAPAKSSASGVLWLDFYGPCEIGEPRALRCGTLEARDPSSQLHRLRTHDGSS